MARERPAFSRGEGGPQGRMWNAGGTVRHGNTQRPAERLPILKSETTPVPVGYRPRSTSVTKMGLETHFCASFSPGEAMRPAAAVAP